ncbi:amidase signature domain-containing protein [Delphinella strobiligena]|nr:amidase signature domain-containing protein [Delphinella strobiligena]
MTTKEAKWQTIARQKQTQRAASIPPEWRLASPPSQDQRNVLDIPRTCNILSDEELKITETYDATDLVGMLRTGGLKSQVVTIAFCKRAAIAHQVTNCLTEIFFDEALHRAQELDAYFKKHKRPIGPLHGLPVSLKDTFRVVGHDASIGIASLCHAPATANSALVDVLLAAGAVLYVKTNIPQTLMAMDSHNNVFGRVLNPANTLLTAGGSSGGEGALLAMRGSPLGIGTDVGGSIRIPAMCNGLYGLKPSHGRIPYAGQESGTPEGGDAVGIRACAGPLARSLRDCELLMRVVADMAAWKKDPEVVAQGWEQQVALPLSASHCGGKKVRVGVVRTDGVATPHPPIVSLITSAVDLLKQSPDVEVVEMDISPLLSKCQRLFNALTGVDGGTYMFDLLDTTNEPLSPWLQPRICRGKVADLEKVRNLHAERAKMQTDFLEIWNRQGGFWKDAGGEVQEVDILICPVAPHSTPPVDAWNTASYTSSFVLLDYPAATLPMRNVRLDDLKGEVEGEVLGSWDKANREIWKRTEKSVWVGGWLCLQVIGRRREERALLEGMSVLEEALEGLNGEWGGDRARL